MIKVRKNNFSRKMVTLTVAVIEFDMRSKLFNKKIDINFGDAKSNHNMLIN